MIIVSDRISGFAKGQANSQKQQRDGELFIPPSLQPVGELPHVLRAPSGLLTLTSTGIQRSSWYYSFSIVAAGVSAGSVINVPPMDAGLWRLRGRIQLVYTGAAPAHNVSQLELNVPAPGVASNVIAYLTQSFAVTTAQVPFEHVFAFDVDGWFLKLTSGATIAGETSRFSLSVEASKLA